MSIAKVVGRCCGWQPAANVSMTIMCPPQQGHGLASASEAAAVVTGSSLIRSGMRAASSRGEVLLSGGAGEQAVVADAMEALGQDMQQEAANELAGRERHCGVAAWALDPVILSLPMKDAWLCVHPSASRGWGSLLAVLRLLRATDNERARATVAVASMGGHGHPARRRDGSRSSVLSRRLVIPAD